MKNYIHFLTRNNNVFELATQDELDKLEAFGSSANSSSVKFTDEIDLEEVSTFLNWKMFQPLHIRRKRCRKWTKLFTWKDRWFTSVPGMPFYFWLVQLWRTWIIWYGVDCLWMISGNLFNSHLPNKNCGNSNNNWKWLLQLIEKQQ